MSTNHQGYTRFLLTTMANRTTLDNPYANSNTPAGLFYGREELLSWIRQKLIVYYRDQPLLLVGLAGMGKTTLLQQLLNSQPGDTHRFAYIPLPGMAQDSLDAFLWTLAEQITRSLQAQGLRLTLPTRRSFNAAPQRAFANYFLEPVLAALKGQYLVLLADDADWLLQPAGDCPLAAEIRAYLYQLGQQQHRIQFLFARTGRESTLPTEALSPFRLPQIALVGPLSREASLAYIQEPVPYKVYADVADLLYTLTEGQPAALQQVCAGLFARWQRQELQQVTLADVVTVVRRQQMAGSGHPLRPPTQPYTAPADPPGATPAGARWRVWLLLLLVPLLLLAGAWLGATFRRPVNVAGPPAGAATATTTLTAAATAALAQVAGTPRATSPPPTRPATQAATMRPAGASPTPLPSTPSPTATPPA
ncbi:MAG: ATP-binding protein, partial [Anaerolineales bacterium]|nr:ATP-binding protein [Anaerolineales bacterium]